MDYVMSSNMDSTMDKIKKLAETYVDDALNHTKKKWSPHPTWNRVYLVTHKLTGGEYPAIIVRRGTEDQVWVLLDEHICENMTMGEAKERYSIEVMTHYNGNGVSELIKQYVD